MKNHLEENHSLVESSIEAIGFSTLFLNMWIDNNVELSKEDCIIRLAIMCKYEGHRSTFKKNLRKMTVDMMKSITIGEHEDFFNPRRSGQYPIEVLLKAYQS